MLRQNDRRGVHFHHNSGTCNLVSRFQLNAIVDRGCAVLAVHIGFLTSDNRLLRVGATLRQWWSIDGDALTLDHRAQVDKFVIKRQREGKQALVLGVKRLRDRSEPALGKVFEIDSNG